MLVFPLFPEDCQGTRLVERTCMRVCGHVSLPRGRGPSSIALSFFRCLPPQVRFIRNLSQHFADQRADVRRAVLACGGGGVSPGAGLSVDEQEAAVGQCFFGLFPSLVVHLKRAEGAVAPGK